MTLPFAVSLAATLTVLCLPSRCEERLLRWHGREARRLSLLPSCVCWMSIATRLHSTDMEFSNRRRPYWHQGVRSLQQTCCTATSKYAARRDSLPIGPRTPDSVRNMLSSVLHCLLPNSRMQVPPHRFQLFALGMQLCSQAATPTAVVEYTPVGN